MVRAQSQRPSVRIFIFASTYELTNSPQKYAIIEASAMRHVPPKAISYAPWLFQNGAGGNATTTNDMSEAKPSPAKPAQITRRLRAYPYTSVSTSPKMYEMGKKRTPAPKVSAPSIGTSTCAIFAGPTRFEQTSTTTKAAITN